MQPTLPLLANQQGSPGDRGAHAWPQMQTGASGRCTALRRARGGKRGRACWWEASLWEPEERRPSGGISPEDWCAPSPVLPAGAAAEAARARPPKSPDPDAACSRFSASELPCCFLRRRHATRPQHGSGLTCYRWPTRMPQDSNTFCWYVHDFAHMATACGNVARRQQDGAVVGLATIAHAVESPRTSDQTVWGRTAGPQDETELILVSRVPALSSQSVLGTVWAMFVLQIELPTSDASTTKAALGCGIAVYRSQNLLRTCAVLAG